MKGKKEEDNEVTNNTQQKVQIWISIDISVHI